MSIFENLYTSRKSQLDEWVAALDSHIACVQDKGRSQTKPTLLLADGFDVENYAPVMWQFPDGHSAPISNFASQQNWLRTLCAMSVVTGNDSYQQHAIAQSEYFWITSLMIIAAYSTGVVTVLLIWIRWTVKVQNLKLRCTN